MDPLLSTILLKVISGVIFAINNAPETMSAWAEHLKVMRQLLREKRSPSAAEILAVNHTASEQTKALQAVVDGDKRGT